MIARVVKRVPENTENSPVLNKLTGDGTLNRMMGGWERPSSYPLKTMDIPYDELSADPVEEHVGVVDKRLGYKGTNGYKRRNMKKFIFCFIN